MRITIPMYEKGRSFLMASGLVKAYGGDHFVYLHLLCQAFENIGKALLLARDYDSYGPQLKSVFGHDVERILAEIESVFGSSILSKAAKGELAALNGFYRAHSLRYGDNLDNLPSAVALEGEALRAELLNHLEEWNSSFASQV